MARALTLVRHGRTSYNAAGRIQGWVDIPLDETGLWQVRRTGRALRELYVGHDAPTPVVVCSDLERARQSAHAFADPLHLEVHEDERLRERHFGDWEGMAVTELAQRFPRDFELWTKGLGGEMRHGAESHEHAGARGWRAIRDWTRRAGEADVFVFSHGALIEQTLQTMYGIGERHPDFASVATMRNAHWARLVASRVDEADRWTLVDYNHGPAEADTTLWEHPEARDPSDSR